MKMNVSQENAVFQSINEIDLGKNVKATVSMTFLKWIQQNKHIQIKQHALWKQQLVGKM